VKAEATSLLEKAARAIQAAEALLARGDADFAVGRSYYAMFYTATALLLEEGVSASKHSTVHALFGERFAKTGRLDRKFHRWLLDAFDKRLESDYGFGAMVAPSQAAMLIEQARGFLGEARRFLGLEGAESPRDQA
jgi:uncharacterized protein (UPF0332 family)